MVSIKDGLHDESFGALGNEAERHLSIEVDVELPRRPRRSAAEERKTGIRVVIKALREEKATDTSAARFLAAITNAAQLDHPHIVPLHGFGTVDGLPYYVSPVIDGVSLWTRMIAAPRFRCTKSCRSPPRSARRSILLNITTSSIAISSRKRCCCTAAARLLPVRARAVGWCGGASATHHARIVLGAPEYISPEQAQGDTDCDGRSDGYSLACIVCRDDLGTSAVRGTGESCPAAPAIRRADAAVLPVARHSAWFGRGRVTRACERPGARFPSAGAFAAALRDGCDSLEAFRPSDRVTAERPIERAGFSLYNTRQSA